MKLHVNSSQFYWLTTGAPATYTNWLAGEPNNYQGVENCIQWMFRKDNRGWNDWNCAIEMRYICEKGWD